MGKIVERNSKDTESRTPKYTNQTTDPASTKSIYYQFSHIFQNCSDQPFHSNFLKTVRNFELGESKKRARNISECGMCFSLALTKNIFCCSGEVSAEEATLSPQRKKSKVISFLDNKRLKFGLKLCIIHYFCLRGCISAWQQKTVATTTSTPSSVPLIKQSQQEF